MIAPTLISPGRKKVTDPFSSVAAAVERHGKPRRGLDVEASAALVEGRGRELHGLADLGVGLPRRNLTRVAGGPAGAGVCAVAVADAMSRAVEHSRETPQPPAGHHTLAADH
jgi:hypothetical protein